MEKNPNNRMIDPMIAHNQILFLKRGAMEGVSSFFMGSSSPSANVVRVAGTLSVKRLMS